MCFCHLYMRLIDYADVLITFCHHFCCSPEDINYAKIIRTKVYMFASFFNWNVEHLHLIKAPQRTFCIFIYLFLALRLPLWAWGLSSFDDTGRDVLLSDHILVSSSMPHRQGGHPYTLGAVNPKLGGWLEQIPRTAKISVPKSTVLGIAKILRRTLRFPGLWSSLKETQQCLGRWAKCSYAIWSCSRCQFSCVLLVLVLVWCWGVDRSLNPPNPWP